MSRRKINKVLVVGMGSIGQRHLRNLQLINPALQLAVWRQHQQTPLPDELHSLACEVFSTAEQALSWRPQAAIVANPAPFHVNTAMLLAAEGVHLFIEKPLSHTLEKTDLLRQLCVRKNLIAMVGYVLRFHPALIELKRQLESNAIGQPLFFHAEVGQYLPDWRPGKDYRTTVSAQENLGGGVLLELSHELDAARWLMGDVASLSANVGKLSDLEIDVEDTADIACRFTNGSFGSVHMDMVQRIPVRTCHVVGTTGRLNCDLLARHLSLVTAAGAKKVELPLLRDDMYVAELKTFFQCIAEEAPPPVGLKDGMDVLHILLAAKKSSREQRQVSLS